MPDTLNAAELRRLAMECAARAGDEKCSADERQRLMTMRESLLALAVNADWLAGKPVQDAVPRPAADSDACGVS